MKKVIVLVLTLVLCLTFCACGKQVESITLKETEISLRAEDTYEMSFEITPAEIENPNIDWSSSDEAIAKVDAEGKITAVAEGTAEITAKSGKASATCVVSVGKKVTDETDYVKIDGLYLDNDYVNEDSESIRMLYVFYTVTTPDSQLKIDSKSMKLNFESGNTYTAEHFPDTCTYMGSHYYSSYLKEVNMGDSVKVVETFEIPKGEFEEGKSITFEKSQIPQMENIIILTDDVVKCDGYKAIAEKADPEGYEKEVNNQKTADAATSSKAKEYLNGYQWSFYVNSTSYEIEFYEPSNFQLRTIYNTVDGKYTVKNGYITLDYPSGYKVDIPYTFTENDIDIDVANAFDVMG